MNPRSKIPIGLLALTLASVVLALLVFWSFSHSGLRAGTNIQMSRGDDGSEKAFSALSPAALFILLISLPAAYWAGRKSGRRPSPSSETGRGQLLDPSFSRAKASLQTAVSGLRADGTGSPPRPDPASDDDPAKPDLGEVISRIKSLAATEGRPARTGPPTRRRLSTTELRPEKADPGPANLRLFRGLALEPRLIFMGQTSLRVAANCPVRTSMLNLIGTMEQIAHCGLQIEQLVKDMDNFVFQANLLALEAAVEAGRPGQCGRGLLAVASKSRQLAICSAEAARNTADLAASLGAEIQSAAASAATVAESFISPGPPPDDFSESSSRPTDLKAGS